MNAERIRQAFPILAREVNGRRLVYLDNAATTQKPDAVLDAVMSFYTSRNANIHRGVHYLSEQAGYAYESAREAVRRFVNAERASEIVFTSGTTASINLVAASYGDACVKEGDEILITEMEHHSNLVPWQELCRRKGAKLTVAPVDDDGALYVDELTSLICGQTKLVCLTHVSNVTGIVNPVREITARAHAAGATVLVDGAQAAGHFPVDVRELGCDFYAFSGHKMFAETGIGVLYGRQSLLERMAPCQFGGGMIATVELERASFAPPPLKFEAGTPNVAAAVSLGAAVAFVTELGLDAIHRHGLAIMEYATEALRKAQGTVLYGAETPRRSGSLSFNLRGVDAYDVGLVLDTMGIAVRTGTHCAAPLVHRLGVDGTVRASFALYTTPQEIDLLADGVARAAKMLLPAHC